MPYANSTAGRLHYDVIDMTAGWHAPAQTILFHHGIGAAAGIWHKWLPWLSGRYRILVFDMRGYGRSSVPASEFTWSLDLLASDVFAVADAAGAERFHLVGESIGGTVALQCALDRPDRIASLTISNGAHVGTTIQRTNEWKARIDNEGIKAWSDQFLRDRFYPGAVPENELAWYAQHQEAWTRDSILDALSVLVGTDLTPRLADIQCPTLLMHGDSSPFIPVSAMADLHRLLPHSSLHVFDHARHGLPFSHAAQCAQILSAFLDRLNVDAADQISSSKASTRSE